MDLILGILREWIIALEPLSRLREIACCSRGDALRFRIHLQSHGERANSSCRI